MVSTHRWPCALALVALPACVAIEPLSFDRDFGADMSVGADAGDDVLGMVRFEAASDVEIDGRAVSFTRAILVGRTEVTREAWAARVGTAPECSATGGAEDCGCGIDPCDARPASEISWFTAIAYCNLRSLNEGLEPCYETANGLLYRFSDGEAAAEPARFVDLDCPGYRLPTSAEWSRLAGRPPAGLSAETACVGGDVCPVASFESDDSGLYDTFGGVWEWTSDWYALEADTARVDPTGPPNGTARMVRGCSFLDTPADCLAASSVAVEPSLARIDVGIRLVRSLP